ncbi:MAG: 50S ribosomal protein L5 [bacterium]
MHPFLTIYNQKAVPKLKEGRTYVSSYLIPRVTKVSVNMGVGDTVGNGKALEEVSELMTQITGQKPAVTKARKAIAGFKIREAMPVGLKVTLRGARMNDFLIKLSQVVLPRTRDFRGLVPTSVTSDGNLNIGIRDTLIFPEVSQGTLSHGLQVTLVSNARTQEEARILYESLGFVFQSAEEAATQARRGRRTNTNYKRS